MMDKDSQLIFESYLKSKNEVILEADDDGWGWTALKIIDPTGITSYPDLGRAIADLINEPSVWNLIKMVFYIFMALPNFGLLAAGAGAVGWGTLRASIKAAIKAGATHESMALAEKTLKTVSESPRLFKGVESVLAKMAEKELISPEAAKEIGYVIRSGKIDNLEHALNVSKAMKSAKSLTSTIAKPAITYTSAKAVSKGIESGVEAGMGKEKPKTEEPDYVPRSKVEKKETKTETPENVKERDKFGFKIVK